MKYKEYKHNNFIVKVVPMTRWEFALKQKPDEASNEHRDWKFWNGFCCDWFGFKFWVDENQLHEQWEEVSENLEEI